MFVAEVAHSLPLSVVHQAPLSSSLTSMWLSVVTNDTQNMSHHYVDCRCMVYVYVAMCVFCARVCGVCNVHVRCVMTCMSSSRTLRCALLALYRLISETCDLAILPEEFVNSFYALEI